MRRTAKVPRLVAPPPVVDAAGRRRSRADLRGAEPDRQYGGKPAIEDISLDIGRNRITALIGPSGCGKSTMIRCFNRMNDLIPQRDGRAARSSTTGRTSTRADVDPVEVRKLIGMVFQKPNPFPKSIYDNIAFGPRVIGMKGSMDGIVERALRRAALWDEVKDRLKDNAYRSRAASSSASASRAASRSSRT